MVGLRAWAEAEREAAEARETRTAASGGCARRPTPRRSCGSSSSSAGRSTRSPARRRGPSGSRGCARSSTSGSAAERDREAVLEVIADLGGLGSVAARAPWAEVEQVLEARFEWERLPLEPLEGGGVHVGALDAMAGLPFRVVAIPGLVEGGYPGVFRPDPVPPRRGARGARGSGTPERRSRVPAPASHPIALALSQGALRPQLSLLWEAPVGKPAQRPAGLPGRFRHGHCPPPRTACSRRAASSTARCRRRASGSFLSYPRADARTGRERLPSLFFAAAASTLAGRPARRRRARAARRRGRPRPPPARGRGRRGRARPRPPAPRRGGGDRDRRGLALLPPVAPRQPGPLVGPPHPLRRPRGGRGRRGPRRAARPARRALPRLGEPPRHLRALRLPVPAPERAAPPAGARARGAPADRAPRARRPLPQRGRALPARAARPRRAAGAATREAARARLAEMAEEALEGLVAGSPPRFTLLWQREKRRFHETVQGWLAREAAAGGAVDARPLRAELRPRPGAGRGGAARPRAARDRPRRRPRAARLRQDRPDRPARRRARPPRLQDRPRPEGRRRRLPRRQAAADPVLRARRGEAPPRRARGRRLPRLRGRGPAGGLPPRPRGGPRVPRRSCAGSWTSWRGASSCRSRAPATSATSPRSAGRRRSCSGARRSRSATARCRTTCG